MHYANYCVNDITFSFNPALSMQLDWNSWNLVMADSLNEKSYVKKKDLFLKLRRNNWHSAILPNIESESRENENNIWFSPESG